MDVMRDAEGRCGLEINAMKSKCMIFNYRGAPIELPKGMEVVEQLRYLGVTVVIKRNCFLQHKKEKIMQTKKMANLTYSIIARSCSKIMIGKTYWKSVVLPGVLYVSSVLTWTRKEMDEMQCIENQVWRQMLGAPRFTPVVALHREIGASTMKCRDMKSKLKMVKHMKTTENGLLRAVAERMVREGSGGWIKQVG